VAVGECGLDYSEGFPSRELQVPWFKVHLELAAKHSLPLYLHIRDAHADFISLLDSAAADLSRVPLCVHCFTGDTEQLSEYARRGFYISLSGHVIRKKVDVKEWLCIIPKDRLLLETDAPYMGFKQCRATEDKAKSQFYPNVPAALAQVATYVSTEAGVPYGELVASTTENALRFLGRTS